MSLDHFFKNLHLVPEVFLGTVIILICVIAYTRIFGLKSLSKMTGFDFVITVAIGNIIGMSINSGNPSILVGAFILLVLYGLNYLISVWRFSSKKASKMLDNTPLLLMKDGKILEENLKKTKVTHEELSGKLREANVIQLSEVRAVILERISCTPSIGIG